jgi:A/G-specific adenine glycosylase
VSRQTWTVGDAPVAAVLEWWGANARPLPWRRSRDVYGVWVSEVMSIQTQVERAAPAWSAWMRRWPTVQALAAAPLADVLGQWQGLGYPRRARDLHRSARIVARSGWPQDLTELPGIGSYVADAIRCFALEQPVLPVDVNVRRVLSRRFGDGTIDVGGDPWRAGQALMEFGQRVCAARPRCGLCPVRDGCPGPDADPEPVARRPRPFAGSLRQRRGQLLRQVLADGAVTAGDADAEAAAGLVGDGLVVLVDGRLLAPR